MAIQPVASARLHCESTGTASSMINRHPSGHGFESTEIPEKYLLGQFIPLHYHYHMLRDAARVGAFREAIAEVVRPGAKVLELGGGTGILSYFAAQDAGKVWCVEQNPALAEAARQFLSMNRGGHRVEVIEADAADYLPPEPVDVVICEMLHAAMLREKQIPVLASFQKRYRQAYGSAMPRFLPEFSFLAVQPVQQSFCFEDYYAPIPFFQPPAAEHHDCFDLSQPAVYAAIDYQQPLPGSLGWQGVIEIERAGWLSALRFVTKNILAVSVEQQRAIEWLNQSLIVPLRQSLTVLPGQSVRVAFAYEPGAPLESLGESLTAHRCGGAGESRRAA